MKVSELRIGNLIYYNGNHNEIGVVSEIMKKDFAKVSSYKIGINNRVDIDYDIEKLKPIPLIEETLLKLQNLRESIFYNGEKLKGFYIGEECLFCIVLIDGRIYYYEQTDSENWGYVGACVDYLHELQNMYYWFNNQKKELTIKNTQS